MSILERLRKMPGFFAKDLSMLTDEDYKALDGCISIEILDNYDPLKKVDRRRLTLSRNSQFTACGDRRTPNDFKRLQPSQRPFACPRTEKFTFCRRLLNRNSKRSDKSKLINVWRIRSKI
jgi:hypothetical protein